MRVRLALIPVIATVALLAGCTTANTPATAPTSTGPADNGVSAMAPSDILAKMQAALAAAKSYHVVGSATAQGQKVDLDLKFSGDNVTGSITTGSATIEVIGVGSDIYLKAPDDFWAAFVPAPQASTLLALIKGKYVKVGATNATIAAQVDPLRPKNLLKLDGTVTKGDTKTINGQPAIALVDSKSGQKVYVATTGEPVPLAIEPGTSPGQGSTSVQFKEYNIPVTITAPAASDVFDLKSLIGG
jgi:hypothetical protein